MTKTNYFYFFIYNFSHLENCLQKIIQTHTFSDIKFADNHAVLSGRRVSLLVVILSPKKIKLLKCVFSLPNRNFYHHLREQRQYIRTGHEAPVPHSIPTAMCDTSMWTWAITWTHHLLSQLIAQTVSIPERWTTSQLLEEVTLGHCQEEVRWCRAEHLCPLCALLFALLLCKWDRLLKSTSE